MFSYPLLLQFTLQNLLKGHVSNIPAQLPMSLSSGCDMLWNKTGCL